jgi:hypothetical protein
MDLAAARAIVLSAMRDYEGTTNSAKTHFHPEPTPEDIAYLERRIEAVKDKPALIAFARNLQNLVASRFGKTDKAA